MKIRKIDDIDFDRLCTAVQKHLQGQQSIFQKIYMYLIDLAHARMSKMDQTKQKRDLHEAQGPMSREAVDVFQNQIHKLPQWQVQETAFPLPPVPHRVVLVQYMGYKPDILGVAVLYPFAMARPSHSTPTNRPWHFMDGIGNFIYDLVQPTFTNPCQRG